MNSTFFEKRKVQRLNWIKLFFFLSLISTFAFLLVKINNMFISVLLAIVLSHAIRPLVDRIEGWLKMDRGLATLIGFSLFGASAIAVIFWTMPFLSEQSQNLRSEIPKYIEGIITLLDRIENKLQVFIPVIENTNVTSQAKQWLIAQATHIAQALPIMLTNSFSVTFLCSFLAFFMVKDSHSLYRGFLSLVPNHVFETTLSLTHQISLQIGQFIRARMLEAFIVGLITGVGLQIISFPFALLLGLFAGLMNLVPYLGPIIGCIPAILVGVVNGMSLFELSIVLTVYIVAQLIDNIILIPILVARMMKLHPVTVVVVVIAGAQFLGILGMIISIPVANAIQVAYHAVYQHIINAEVTR